MRTPPLTSHWWVAHPATREPGNTVFDSRRQYTQHKREALLLRRKRRMDAVGWSALPSLFLQRQALWTPYTASVVLSIKTSVNTHLLPSLNRLARVPRGALDPLHTPAGPPLPALSRNTRPVPASSRPLALAVSQPGMSSPPSQPAVLRRRDQPLLPLCSHKTSSFPAC